MEKILVHYHEIALKGKNRPFFEEKLVENIKRAVGAGATVRRLYGRIEVAPKAGKLNEVLAIMPDIFGISSFSPAISVRTGLAAINKAAVKMLESKKAPAKTFKVETKRGYKQFKLNSMEISAEVGAHILKNSKLKVDIKKPDIIIHLEVLKDVTYIYTEKKKGSGGLPVGTSGRMLVLLSGGIDSPVASYLMMKRGATLDFIHFHSYPFTDKASIEKVKELLDILAKYGAKGSRLFLAPIIDFQKEAVKKCEGKHRVILYRRLMYRVAEALARKIGAKALVSGDNLGQVASQTVENMAVIGHGIGLPIMRPLVGFDKEEIIDFAKRVGTFDISILPHGDCCSIFLPKNPATKANLEDVLKEEKKLGMEKWMKKILKTIEY